MAIQASCVLAIAICSQYYFVLTNQDDFAKKRNRNDFGLQNEEEESVLPFNFIHC